MQVAVGWGSYAGVIRCYGMGKSVVVAEEEDDERVEEPVVGKKGRVNPRCLEGCTKQIVSC